MGLLLIGLLVFLALHSVRVFAEGWRAATISRIGPMPWKALYSVISIAGFLMIVYGYGQARMQMPLWVPPVWTKHLTALLMLPVFMLFVAAYVPRNGLKARLGHPQILSVKLWALAHLLSNGNLADVLLFGSFLVWAILDYRAARERDRNAAGSPHDPLSAASAPSRRESSGAMTAVTVATGLLVYAAFVMGLHSWLIGVRPV